MVHGLSYASLVQSWPKGRPLLCLGGAGWRRPMIATAWVERAFDHVMAAPFGRSWGDVGSSGEGPIGGDDGGPWAGIGLVSYDQFRPGCVDPAPSRFFAIYEALVWDSARGDWVVKGGRPLEQDWDGLSAHELDQVLRGLQATTFSPLKGALGAVDLALRPLANASDYLQKAHHVLEDIRAGHYYQLNLLRYFETVEPPSPLSMAARLDRCGGPMSAWLSWPGLSLVSFSPERFFSGSWDSSPGSWVLEAWPIKGTARRDSDLNQDQSLREGLERSAKDRAELAMIVDLLRNDLARISEPRSVVVLDPGSVQSFSHVHHLVARIQSRLDSSLRMGDVLSSLCPAGSITGAPKGEVMDHIRTYEGRERRYFMGHILQWCREDGFDSSILIRTAVAEGEWKGEEARMEYAAGSGLVIHSDPEAELREIEAKVAVLGPLKL